MYKTLGFYLNCDDAVCVNDAPAGFTEDDYSKWAGFEGWKTPAVIFDHEESDSPTHCKTCEKLIPHGLTSDGYAYVAEKLSSDLAYNAGRPEIYGQWWDAYGQNFDESDLREIITEAIEARRRTTA